MEIEKFADQILDIDILNESIQKCQNIIDNNKAILMGKAFLKQEIIQTIDTLSNMGFDEEQIMFLLNKPRYNKMMETKRYGESLEECLRKK